MSRELVYIWNDHRSAVVASVACVALGATAFTGYAVGQDAAGQLPAALPVSATAAVPSSPAEQPTSEALPQVTAAAAAPAPARVPPAAPAAVPVRPAVPAGQPAAAPAAAARAVAPAAAPAPVAVRAPAAAPAPAAVPAPAAAPARTIRAGGYVQIALTGATCGRIGDYYTVQVYEEHDAYTGDAELDDVGRFIDQPDSSGYRTCQWAFGVDLLATSPVYRFTLVQHRLGQLEDEHKTTTALLSAGNKPVLTGNG